MKRLVVDGNSVYEIDEDCVRRRHPPKECDVYNHLKTNNGNEAENNNRKISDKKWQKRNNMNF